MIHYSLDVYANEANLNPENALGAIASMEKALADYMEQLNRPFKHEERLRELLLKQQEINRQLDLDKGESQVVANDNMQQDDPAADTFVERLAASRIARDQAKDLGVVT